MGLAQIPFIINFFWSIKHGKKVNDNPWEATTLEWTAPSPAAARKFRYDANRLSRPLRIQPPWTRSRFHHANEPVEPRERVRRKTPEAVLV